MNIEKEETGTLTATVRVKLGPEDYNPGLEKALKEQRRNAVLPGFRPGQVPMAIIRKRVGKALLVDEVERLLDTSLKDYLRENAIRVLGQPLPKEQATGANNWDVPGEFEFAYELGIAPAIDVELDRGLGLEYPVVEVTDELVQREMDDIRRRFGKLEDAAASEAKDLLLGDMIELGPDGAIKEGGIMHRTTISLEFIEDDAVRDSLAGKAAGDEVTVDPHKLARDHDDLARMLGVDHERVHHLEGNFLFRIAEIKRMAPADLGQELFDRVFGKDAVADEAAFRERVAQGLDSAFRRDSDSLFKQLVMDKLCERANPDLPDAFLKRWIQETSEKTTGPEEVERNYASYAAGIRRQLVEDRVIERYGLEAKDQELEAFAMRQIADQFAQFGMPAPEEARMRELVARTLGDGDRLRKTRDAIVQRKLTVHFKTLLEPAEKKMSFDAFINLARSARPD